MRPAGVSGRFPGLTMGAKKWSEIKKLSKATEADRDEARAELEGEIRIAGGPWTIHDPHQEA